MDLRLHRGASTPDVAARFVARGAQVSALCAREAYYMRDYGPLRDKARRALEHGTKEDWADVLRETYTVGEHFVVNDEWRTFQKATA